MARVGVEMPGFEELPALVRAAAETALAVALEETTTAIKSSGLVPVNTGTGRRGLGPAPIVYRDGRLVSGIQATGLAAQYMPTMEDGRQSGARGPSFRHLMFAPGSRDAKTTDEAAQRGGWVNRKLRDKVEALTAKLQADYAKGLKATRKTKAGKPRKSTAKAARFRQQARFLIARGVADKIHRAGIVGRRYARAQEGFLRTQFATRFAQQLRRQGLR